MKITGVISAAVLLTVSIAAQGSECRDLDTGELYGIGALLTMYNSSREVRTLTIYDDSNPPVEINSISTGNDIVPIEFDSNINITIDNWTSVSVSVSDGGTAATLDSDLPIEADEVALCAHAARRRDY